MNLVFGTFCAAMAVHTFVFFPETAGKPLEEIEEMFALGERAWKTRNNFGTARRMEKGEFDDEKATVLHKDHVETTENAAK